VGVSATNRKEFEMNATTVAVDLAKNVFELAVADTHGRVVERHRLSRGQFERWFANRAVDRVVMEACGSAHHWGRWLTGLGIEVRLLPPRYVRPYVKRNKTDAADAAALLEALQALHRTRSLWMATRTARINALRGFCREFGITIVAGSRLGLEQIGRVAADPQSAIPPLLRETLSLLIEEIRLLEARIARLETQLGAAARESASCTTLLSVPGVGLLTATAMVAATGGTVTHFQDARHFASWLGLTPKEHSSGSTRHLGRISKRGDRYRRMLLTHGARSVLRAATVAQRTGRSLDGLRQWALAVQARSNHNKATCALANKRARICHAALRDQEPFASQRVHRKLTRQAYPMPA
jgi:transposase